MTADDTAYHDRLESLVERQQETLGDQEQVIQDLREAVEDQQSVIDTLEAPRAAAEDGVDLPVTRRGALTAGGVLAFLTGGVGMASASVTPTGTVGTENRPLETLHTAGLAGPLTGGTELSSLVGDGLTVDETGALTPAGTVLEANAEPPVDIEQVLGGMEQDDDGAYLVTTDHELQAMQADRSADYRLANDIEAVLTGRWNGGDGFEPIGDGANTFDGSLDGQGYIISGLTIDRSDTNEVGLFGQLGSGATVSNVRLENATVTGTDNVGPLAGSNEGTVESSSATGSVSGRDTVGGLVGNNGYDGTVKRSHATGTVAGRDFVGGLVGYTDGTLRQSYATGTVVGGRKVGGLVGENNTILWWSYATGAVAGESKVGGLVGENSDDVSWSYATGAVDGRDSVGGLIGNNAETTSLSYWDTDSTGQPSSDGIATGLTTSEMQGAEAETNMSGLDFASNWATVDAETDSDVSADDYPVLQALDRAEQLEARS